MNKKILECELSEKGIDKVIEQLNQYKLELDKKCLELQNRVADRLAELANSGFSVAIAEETILGGSTTASVGVHTKPGDTTVVYTTGADAIWCEFGTGVYYNGTAGSSPHPKGTELGFTIGSYGQGKGRRKAWCFYQNGELVWTHGVPASMPMYKAFENTLYEIADIAREVFGT